MNWTTTDLCSSTLGDLLTTRSSSTPTTSPKPPTTPSYSFLEGLVVVVVVVEVEVEVELQRTGPSVVDRDGQGQLLAPRHIPARSIINGTPSACDG